MPFVLSLPVTDASTAIIIISIYESFRMLGDALLAIRGREASGHDPHTQMIKELFTLNIATERPLQVLLNIKDLRHKINYKGYRTSVHEAEDAVDVARKCYEPVRAAVSKEVDTFSLASS